MQHRQAKGTNNLAPQPIPYDTPCGVHREGGHSPQQTAGSRVHTPELVVDDDEVADAFAGQTHPEVYPRALCVGGCRWRLQDLGCEAAGWMAFWLAFWRLLLLYTYTAAI